MTLHTPVVILSAQHEIPPLNTDDLILDDVFLRNFLFVSLLTSVQSEVSGSYGDALKHLCGQDD